MALFRTVLQRINKLLDLSALFFGCCLLLAVEPLVNFELTLGPLFFSPSRVGLPEPVMRVGEMRFEADGLLVFRNSLRVILALGIEDAELKMGVRKAGIEPSRFFEQFLDLRKRRRILGFPLSPPQAERVIVK